MVHSRLRFRDTETDVPVSSSNVQRRCVARSVRVSTQTKTVRDVGVVNTFYETTVTRIIHELERRTAPGTDDTRFTRGTYTYIISCIVVNVKFSRGSRRPDADVAGLVNHHLLGRGL